MQPNIYFINLHNEGKIVNTWAQDRKCNITENEERNDCVIKLANDYNDRNISTIVLIQVIEHGKFLSKKIKNSVFVHGSTEKSKRQKILNDFSNGKFNVLIASVIADEGLDIPTLSVLINAGGGKSPTRAKQRVGRVIRKGSDYAIVYDFNDVGRWSSSHSRKRKKILKEERLFKIENISSDEIFTNKRTLF